MIFTNTHIHVFTDQCVSKNFLRIIPQRMVRRLAPQILAIASSAGGRTVIRMMAKWGRNKNSKKRNNVDKTISFLNTAMQATQGEVLGGALDAVRKFDPAGRVVVLTMNMDYMDDALPPMRFESQLSDVMDLKRHNPAALVPFLGIDPRHCSEHEVVAWAKQYFETGFVALGNTWPYFSGAKIYPALGFFPFDRRLFPLYKYLEAQELPVMTHCTRVGSQYIGRTIESLIPRDADWSHLDTSNPAVADAVSAIRARIGAYYEKGWIKNNKLGENDFACDLFSHPENYVPILAQFPRLKLCLAHLGGSNEIFCDDLPDDLKQIRDVDSVLWFDRIEKMMLTYPNLYADISYTLSSFAEEKNTVVLDRVMALLANPQLTDRILFGTDFFMTEQEMREAELYEITRQKLAPWWRKITVENTARYLGV